MRYGRDFGARRTPWNDRGPDRDRVADAQRFHYSAAYGGLENDPQHRYERERGTGPARGPIGFDRPRGRGYDAGARRVPLRGAPDRGYDRGFGGTRVYRAFGREYDRDFGGRGQYGNLRQHGRGFIHEYDRDLVGGRHRFGGPGRTRLSNPLV